MSVVTLAEPIPKHARGNVVDRLGRRMVKRQLRGLRDGEILLDGTTESCPPGESSDLRAMIRVNDSRFYRAAVLGDAVSAAESYVRGDWDCDQLTSLFRVFIRNMEGGGRLRARS